jgi:hypothetical protein
VILDPKTLLLLPGLVGCHQQPHCETLTVQVGPAATTPTVQTWRGLAPVYEWPERREPMEGGDHPAHGEGSDESPMFVGIVTNSNVASGQIITVDSGASASPYIHNGWLPRGLNLVTSAYEFVLVDQISPSPLRSHFPENNSPDTTRHRGNPSAIKIQRTLNKHPRG